MRERNSHRMKSITYATCAWIVVGAVAILASLVPLASNAFGAGETEAASAEHPWDPFEMMGITGIKCRGSYTVDDEKRFWVFQSEPEVTAVDPDGAAGGKLKTADVIVAIDGLLITTRKAGERLTALEPGESVAVTVRRGGKTFTETIVSRPIPVAEKSRLKAAIAPAPVRVAELSKSIEELARVSEELVTKGELLRVDVLDLPELSEMPDLPELTELNYLRLELEQMLPPGWLGFGLSFKGQIKEKEGERAEWDFDAPPKIHNIEAGSPAEAAGLEVGDVITHIDGIKIDSERGGDRFSTIEPGQKIEWTIERSGAKRTVEMTAGERPEPEALAVPEEAPQAPDVGAAPAPEDQPIQYTGKLGETEVEVRGAPTIRVTVDEERGVIVIRSRDAVTRLRMTKKR